MRKIEEQLSKREVWSPGLSSKIEAEIEDHMSSKKLSDEIKEIKRELEEIKRKREIEKERSLEISRGESMAA